MKNPFRLPTKNHIITALLLAILMSGCQPRTKVPIDTIRYDAGDVKGPRMLFVFLHGNGDRNSVFEDEGLIAAVRARGLSVDIVSVDAHIGYYIDGTIMTRLREDVIGPARTKGYERIWLIGNSLGGFGSVSYARAHPNDISGIVLLGPFLGERPLITEISQAGGLLLWDPGEIIMKTREDDEKQMWVWFKEHGRQGQFNAGTDECQMKHACFPKIYLGYGAHDRFTFAQELLASLLPQEQVLAVNGGHDWPTWKKLWELFLTKNIFGNQ